ncbi:MAG: DUF302 domain-containing protein [Proteobacteria bacterium]|nr:DUF302 domain-containing protein [Pseudomonadota bacterium]
MRRSAAWLLLWMLCCALPLRAAPVEVGPEQDLVVRYTVDKPFDDVVFELNFAITDHNFRITGRNSIGAGLRERGYTDFPNVEVIHFCSLELAREVLLLDPGFVAHMPCRVTVHEDKGRTVVSLIKLPLNSPDPRVNDFARRMNATLTEIVEFAVGM